jgi:hypothetical protein
MISPIPHSPNNPYYSLIFKFYPVEDLWERIYGKGKGGSKKEFEF